jgi:MFS family permease
MGNFNTFWYRFWYEQRERERKKEISVIYVLGAATVELVAVSQIKPFIQQKWKLETQSLGLMSTTTFLGEIIGGIVWAHLSDKHGREKVFLATSCLMFLFSLLLPFCWTFWQFCWMRLALGFAIGGGLSVDFVYFIECVPPRNRSFRSAFIILIGIAGGRNEYLFISYVFKYLFFSTLVLYSACSGLLLLNRFGYKSFLAACSIPSAILLLGRCFWRYESPKYLAARGKLREAENLLQEIAKINGAEHKLGYFELTPVHKTEEREKSDPKESFKGHWLLISLASVCFFCQTSAYYGLTLWMSQFLRPWGVSPSQMLLMVGLAEIPGLIVTTLLLKYYSQANGVLLCFNFGIASALSLIIFLASDTKSFVLSFCALYFCIVSIWTIL